MDSGHSTVRAVSAWKMIPWTILWALATYRHDFRAVITPYGTHERICQSRVAFLFGYAQR